MINTKDFKKIVEAENFNGIILDVRTPFEWRESGIINNALTKNAYDPELKTYIKQLNKNKQYYVYCHSGSRSSSVVKLMRQYGISGININDGISGWIKNKYELSKYIEQKPINIILQNSEK